MSDDPELSVDDYCKELHARLCRNVESACVHYAGKLQDTISRTQPRQRYSGKYVSYKGLDPSAPGTPPKQLSSELIHSIAWEMDCEKILGRVGSSHDYALFLEFGTTTMQPRPYFSITINQEAEAIEKLLTAE